MIESHRIQRLPPHQVLDVQVRCGIGALQRMIHDMMDFRPDLGRLGACPELGSALEELMPGGKLGALSLEI